MNMDLVYLVTDTRSPETEAPEPQRVPAYPIAMLSHVPDGVGIDFANETGFVLELPDDDASSVWEESEKQITVHLPSGDLILEPLTAESYARWARPFIPEAPRLLDDTAVQRYWRRLIRIGRGG